MMSFKSTFKYLSNIFQQLDLFGVPIQLQIRKKPMFHSYYGATLSLLLICFIAYSFISMVVDMFERKNPVVLSNVEFVENPTLLELPFNQYFFALAVSDQFGIPIVQQNDHLYYVIQVTACTRTNNGTQLHAECSTYLMKPCNENMIDTKLQSEMNASLLFIANSYCIDPEDWKNSSTFKLEGTLQSTTFSSVLLSVTKCDNITMPNQCASQEEIDARLFNSYVGALVPDRLLNQQQQGNPYKTVSKLISTKTSSAQSKIMHLGLMKSFTETTENFLYYFGSTIVSSALQFNKQVEYTEAISSSNIIQFILNLEDRQITYIRSYDNILNILGSIGGLLELLIFLTGLILIPLNTLGSELYLANQIYQYEKEQPKRKVLNHQVSPEQNQNVCIIMDNKSFQANQLQHYVSKLVKLKHQTLNLGVIGYLFQFGDTKQKIRQSIEQIYTKLDTQYILNKINEIEKLKSLIFSQDQLKLFNYISKPTIVLHNSMVESVSWQTTINSSNQQAQSIEGVLHETYIAYKSIVKDNQVINTKLINMLDRDMREFLEHTRKENQGQEISNEMLSSSVHQINRSAFIEEIDQILQM